MAEITEGEERLLISIAGGMDYASRQLRFHAMAVRNPENRPLKDLVEDMRVTFPKVQRSWMRLMTNIAQIGGKPVGLDVLFDMAKEVYRELYGSDDPDQDTDDTFDTLREAMQRDYTAYGKVKFDSSIVLKPNEFASSALFADSFAHVTGTKTHDHFIGEMSNAEIDRINRARFARWGMILVFMWGGILLYDGIIHTFKHVFIVAGYGEKVAKDMVVRALIEKYGSVVGSLTSMLTDFSIGAIANALGSLAHSALDSAMAMSTTTKMVVGVVTAGVVARVMYKLYQDAFGEPKEEETKMKFDTPIDGMLSAMF